MPPGTGALTEGDGRAFMLLMDMSRYLVNEITQEHNFSSINDASQLRVERMDSAAKLTAKMWSYWHSAPAGPGVYEMLLSWCGAQTSTTKSVRNRELGAQQKQLMTSALHLLVTNELKTWPRQRITGAFHFVSEASDGSALLIPLSPPNLESETRTVYKVKGISTSLGDLLRSNGKSPPACLGLTLLPFMGTIVYDGTLRGMQIPPPLVARQTELAAAAEQAVRDGTVLGALPAVVDAPLEGKHVRISGLQAKPELNGTLASAGDFDAAKGRYAVRLRTGAMLALKPANLAEVSEAEVAAAAPAGTLVGSDLTPFQQEVQEEVRAMAAMALPPGPPGKPGGPGGVDDMSMWVFRRYGYTERQNPEHTFMIMAGPLPIPARDCPPGPPGTEPMMAMMMSGMGEADVWHKAAALVPTVDEILAALRSALKNALWEGRGKPKYVAVDAKELVDRLEEVLAPAGVQVGYYPPPSNEELATIPGSDVGGGV